MKEQRVPQLRFSEFSGEWIKKKVKDVLQRYSNPVVVEKDTYYQQIGIRSHGKGIFHKKLVNGHTLGSKRVFWVKENALVVNIVFAWEQAISRTTENEKGMIASHRFPMYLPTDKEVNVDFLLKFFLTPKGKTLLELASPGGAGRNKTLGQQEFEKLSFAAPSLSEQQKIASFFINIDQKIIQITQKKILLEEYKKGVMQKLFSQELRLKDDKGTEFPKWESKKGNELFDNISNKEHNSDLPILAITQEHGAIPRDMIDYKISVSERSVESYKVVEVGDFIISLRSFQGGIEYSNYKGICSPAYIVLRPNTKINDQFYKFYFKTECYIQLLNKKLEGIRDGKMISYKYFSEIDLPFPSLKEQAKIASFLSTLDKKIEHTKIQIEKIEQWKKGLLQKMFI